MMVNLLSYHVSYVNLVSFEVSYDVAKKNYNSKFSEVFFQAIWLDFIYLATYPYFSLFVQ